ncbi:putative RNA-directed DNA polymerase from transposon X-element [Colletotrichum orbiculare MAFF 240422]|uniref:RNA-directed DNA polymerase from transposon X-element n=1 Tax=Colletotrichum orbiculare (strain 104-T / ATCC 96160 / CBS 514.97 / LARS 414 / MAFF 240422) TaxID=1213857 RepID=A0A484G2T1_COLOR|nr:putative RNA-directed DNA polymerase from transposon X-element [Colletotrichum orbiculare MAFF 240422]
MPVVFPDVDPDQPPPKPRESTAPLRVAQANVKCAPARLRALQAYMELNPGWHIVALQDVPPHLPWIRFKHYYTVYAHQGDFELTEDNDPIAMASLQTQIIQRPRDKQLQIRMDKMKAIELFKVAFLVSTSIPISDWRVDWLRENKNRGLLATLHLQSPSTPIYIHNAYNAFSPGGRLQLNIDALLHECSQRGNDFIVMDSNLHHPHYGGPKAKAEPDAVKLVVGCLAALMLCTVQHQKIPFTYSRGTSTDKNTSTIDIGWLGPELKARFLDCRLVPDALGPESDHRVLETKIDLTVGVKVSRPRWSTMDPRKFRELVAPPLLDLNARYSRREIGLDDFFAEAHEITSAAGNKLLKSTVHRSFVHPGFGRRLKKRRPSLRERHTTLARTAKLGIQYGHYADADEAKRVKEAAGRILNPERTLKTHNTRKFRYFAADLSLHEAAKFGRNLRAPRTVPGMGKLEKRDPTDIIVLRTYIKDCDKAMFLLESIWPRWSHLDQAPPVLELPEGVSADNNDITDEDKAQRDLQESELSETLRHVPKGKSPGHDGVPGDGWKMLLPSDDCPEDVFTAVFEAPLQDCLEQSYHPLAFKRAATVMLRKPGKEAWRAKAYRPVALLPSLGKVLEKLVARRLAAWLAASGHLPNEQFGFQGRCTTQALEIMVNAIYRNWSARDGGKKCERFVSIMALDMTGAYDHVVREVLLRIMADLGVPSWIIRFVLSFLSMRSTTICIPGYESQAFWINIGIPQGSPLSPVLFVLFSIPIIKKLKTRHYGFPGLPPLLDMMLGAFVDDITVLVASTSHQNNCLLLAHFYKGLTEFARELGISFGHAKTQVLHLHSTKTSEDKRFKDMPDVEGFPAASHSVITSLGVKLDYQLNWEEHVAHVLYKVRNKMWNMMRVTSSVYGQPVLNLRTWYMTNILPIFAYACPVWFVRTADMQKARWSIAKGLAASLEKQHTYCVKKLSGALWRTKTIVILKELYIEKLDVYLARRCLAYRAKNSRTPEGKRLMDTWKLKEYGINEHARSTHPFNVTYGEAITIILEVALALYDNEQRDEEMKSGKKRTEVLATDRLPRRVVALVKRLSMDWSDKTMSDRWEKCRADNKGSRDGLTRFRSDASCWNEAWGRYVMNWYKTLTRAECTMLMQLRTGLIGLNSCLFWMKQVTTYFCPCQNGKSPHTAKHLFMHCTKLEKQRQSLARQIPHFTFNTLVTRHSKVASRFAIENFGLQQYEWTRKHMDRVEGKDVKASKGKGKGSKGTDNNSKGKGKDSTLRKRA